MEKEKELEIEKDIKNKLKILKTDEERFYYLEEIKEKIDMLNKKTRKTFYKILGDHAFKIDKLKESAEAYENAGYIKGLIEVGKKYLKKGWIGNAGDIFMKVKYNKGLIEVGNKWFKKGDLEKAVEAYKEAKYRKGLVKVANEYIKIGLIEDAIKTYEIIGDIKKITELIKKYKEK
ncbi:MAG: hypothetical protein QXO12_00545 [Candidatus Pacearchaeota archaeon]